MKMWRTTTLNLLLILLFCLATGCSGQDADRQTVTAQKPAAMHERVEESVPADAKNILAKVNGSPITRAELAIAVRRTFGRDAVNSLEPGVKKKVLQTLVASRAISQVAKKALSTGDRAEIDGQVDAYREELLVNKYLLKNAHPARISDAMIRHYYESHLEDFGAKTIKTYEMITSTSKLTSGERDALVLVLKKQAEKKDWSARVLALKKTGFPVVYRKGETSGKVLDRRLLEMIKNLSAGQSSSVTIIDGAPCLVRLLDEKHLPPQRLADVYGRIKKMLAPARVKDAIREVSEKVLKDADVVYK